MKKLLFALLLLSLQASAQRLNTTTEDKIDLQLSRYEAQVKVGEGFIFTGMGLMAASSLFLLSNKSSKENYASAVGVIGGAFSLYGFIALVDSDRIKRKAHSWQKAITAK